MKTYALPKALRARANGALRELARADRHTEEVSRRFVELALTIGLVRAEKLLERLKSRRPASKIAKRPRRR